MERKENRLDTTEHTLCTGKVYSRFTSMEDGCIVVIFNYCKLIYNFDVLKKNTTLALIIDICVDIVFFFFLKAKR